MFHYISKGLRNDQIIRNLELININQHSQSSSIDQYIFAHYKHFTQGHFHRHYPAWRMKRIQKVLEIYGLDFKGKRILETGGGLGDIGAFFAELGAEVISLEGRVSNRNFANLKYRHLKNFTSVDCDLEMDFSHLGRFDLIINFGSLEVVKNIDTLMKSCAALSDKIVLETLVCDSENPKKVIYVKEPYAFENAAYISGGSIDSPIHSIGARPSPSYIEKYFTENGFSFVQHFDEDLNTQWVKYDWSHKNDNRLMEHQYQLRRFWQFKK